MNDNTYARNLYVAKAKHGSSASSLVRPRRCRQCGADASRSDKRCPTCGQPLSICSVRR